MKEIKLTPNKVALVDDEDYDLVSSMKWHLDKGYARHAQRINGKVKHIFMHRLILNAINSDLYVDHINKNTLDNRKSNLRLCTMSQNSANRKPYGKSNFLGVSILNNGKYRQIIANIRKNKVQYLLGSFATEEEAAMAYDKAAIELHGEFARLNFPELAMRNGEIKHKEG